MSQQKISQVSSTLKKSLLVRLAKKLVIAAAIPCSLALTACQTSLPGDGTDLSSSSTVIPSNSTSNSSLAVSTPSATIPGGTSVTITAAGGTAPYSYYITGSSNSTINSSSGLFTAGLVAEVVQVLVQDATGATSLTTIQVTASTGSTVNVYRSFNATNGDHLFSRDAGEGARAGYQNEGAVFSVYPTQVSGSAPLYRCANTTTGIHMLSRDAGCEGQTQEGVIGYVADSAANATTQQLLRFYQQTATAIIRLETLSVNEGTSAGFTLEGPLGYVAPAQ